MVLIDLISKRLQAGSVFWGSTLLLLTSSVGLNLIQARRIEALSLASPAKPFRSGVAPAIVLQGTDDSNLKLDLRHDSGGLPVLFYWFSPSCSWCQANIANFKALSAQSAGRYRLVPVSGASLDDLDAYRERLRLPFTLYHMDAEPSRQYRFSGTPETVLVTSSGVLVKRWPGAYGPATLTQIEKTLSVRLPGITTEKAVGE